MMKNDKQGEGLEEEVREREGEGRRQYERERDRGRERESVRNEGDIGVSRRGEPGF